MSDTLLEQPLGSNYNNQSLFSDHYLNHILHGSDVWQHAFPQAQEFLAWLRDLYAQEKAQLTDYKESQLEDKWFKKIFERLGHTWEGQAVIPAWKGNIKKPDFVFFPDEDARKTAVSLQNSTDYAKSALAVGEVKQWGISLDKNRVDAPVFDDKNPMYQIDSYLTLTKLDWGILSNGRQWRLLYREESRSLDNYFEIDLLTMLEQSDRKQAAITATYFWLFFNQAAFQLDSDGHLLLHDVYTQSQHYKRELEENLRGNAYRALEQLILGFFNSNPTLSADNADHRDEVYRNSLYLLYRLLFLFYGESRALLPIHNAAYQGRYSLQKITECLNRNSRKYVPAKSLPPTGRYYWLKLSETFRLISGDDEQLNQHLGVPRYNGGLFNSQQHLFLEQYIIGDYHLMQAIDYLATRRIIQKNNKPKYETVDYSTLDVRQLGSIYEGLLEYKVAVAVEEMVTVSKKGVETWIPLAQKGKSKAYDNRKQRGDLYLTTDKGERKATGSYYTPDYIVEYIVENTLSPLVAQVREQAADGSFADGILRLNVLDPAMGSGHFLVEAMEYLARVLVVDAEVTVTSEVTVTLASDLLYWKRRVVEACIYGVDKNPMAVELAKLSLWLKTAVANKPLSFLDHHLQHGDSLIGASLKDLSKSPIPSKSVTVSANQKSLIDDNAFTRDVGLAVGGVMAIERATSDTIEDVHLKEKIWAELQEKHTSAWRLLADVWVSTFFGNTMSREEYRALADRLQGRDSLMSDAQAERLLNHPAVTDNDYFHWQFIFPEVFFDELGLPLNKASGFDAVIGNPPYDELSEVALNRPIFEKDFIAASPIFKEAATYRINLYRLFIAKSMHLTKSNKFHGFIVPMSLLGDRFTYELRKLILETKNLLLIEAFPQKDDPKNRVFPDAKLPTCIYILMNAASRDDFTIRTHIGKDIIKNSPSYAASFDKIKEFDPHNLSIPTTSQQDWNLIQSLLGNPTLGFLKDVATSSPGEIMFNKQFKKYLSDSPPGEVVLRGAHIGRYEFQEVPKQGSPVYLNRDLYLSERSDESSKAYAYQSKRIGYQRGSAIDNYRRIIATMLPEGVFCSDTVGYFSESKYDLHTLIALLNAPVAEWRFRLTSATNHVNPYELDVIPVPVINFTTTRNERTAVSQKFCTLYQQPDYAAIQQLTAAELAANRNDTIHDLLAFLAEQMIDMNKQKQAALEAFWLDLEGVAEPIAFATLRNKGKWEKSLHKAVPAARPFVNENSRSSVPLSASLSWNEEAFKGFVKLLVKKVRYFNTIVQVYRDHETAVSSLDRQLTATDHLIDQIVYQLYGLTDEDIKIVEG